MIGKDLIIYILENNLEGEKLSWFITIEEAAVKFNVGIETIKLWFALGFISGIKIEDNIYIFTNNTKKGGKNKYE